MKIVLVIAATILVCQQGIAQKLAPLPNNKPEWSQPTEPFRIAGNLYYVGTYDLGAYLITTSKGLILINTGLAESASLIKKNIEQLGFHYTDIKILLTTQAHFDHVGAMAEIKKETGAKMMVDWKDAPVLADGGNSDYFMGGKGPLFVPVKADRLLHDHDTVRLGGQSIVLLHHPGHTKGSCSFLLPVQDEQRTYTVLIANMPTILDDSLLPSTPKYPDIGKDYARTLKEMKSVAFDVWVASHASQFNLHAKRHPGDAYNPAAFADRAGYDKELRELEEAYQKTATR